MADFLKKVKNNFEKENKEIEEKIEKIKKEKWLCKIILIKNVGTYYN